MFRLLLPVLLALAPVAARATPPAPDDPAAAVPETRYRAPQAYLAPEQPATTPDRHWIAANRSLLDYHPMMLTRPEPAPAPAPARPEAREKPAPAHEHHAGHGGKGAR
ncbi:hypothetical protein [Massilia yuzhufengensis]|uniref:Ribonuclease E n=1 Tax=Massilia yuzhufengensis TaxID=1164594 RepID=A0A1I1PTR8_9BURK|nr:hypothetical protein [Massilia yuzhufengensis]SFD09330.1 ribonuclease E [Massilia yuzhufengensis]